MATRLSAFQIPIIEHMQEYNCNITVHHRDERRPLVLFDNFGQPEWDKYYNKRPIRLVTVQALIKKGVLQHAGYTASTNIYELAEPYQVINLKVYNVTYDGSYLGGRAVVLAFNTAMAKRMVKKDSCTINFVNVRVEKVSGLKAGVVFNWDGDY